MFRMVDENEPNFTFYITKLFLMYFKSSFHLFYRILNLVKSFPNGISDKDIQKEIPDIDVKKRVEILNKLVRQVNIKYFVTYAYKNSNYH